MKRTHRRTGTVAFLAARLHLAVPLLLLWTLADRALGQQSPARPALRTVSLTNARAREGVWNQLVGLVENPTDTEVQAEVVYPATDPKLGTVLYGRRAWLAPRSRSWVSLAIRPGELPGKRETIRDDFAVSIQSVELLDARTGRLLDRKGEQRFIKTDPKLKVACYIDDDPQGDTRRDDASYSYLKEAETYLYTLTTITLPHPPDQWYGYAGANLLLVGNLDPWSKARRPSQVQAILDWVSQGGVLVLFANDSMPRMLAGPLGRAAGVSCAGVDSVRELSVRMADGKGDVDVTLPQPTPYADLVVDGADVLARANGLPLLTRTRYGQGHVFVLATPVGTLGRKFQSDPAPPEAAKNDQAATQSQPPAKVYKLLFVWRDVGQAMVFTPAVRMDPFLDPLRLEPLRTGETRDLVANKLEAISGRRGTDRVVIMAWLGGLTALTGVWGLFMRLRRRGERTWLVMLPVAAALTGGLFVAAQMRKVDPALSYVGMAMSAGDGRAMVYQATGYYSPTELTATAAAGSDLGWLIPIGHRSTQRLEKTTLRRADGMIWPEVEILPDSARAFLAGAVIDLPGLEADVYLGPGGLTGTITNRTGQGLTDAILYVRGRAFAVGDLPADKAVAVSVGPDRRLGPGEFIPRSFLRPEDRQRAALLEGLTGRPRTAGAAGLSDHEPYLLGWAQRPLLSPGPELAKAPAKGMMLLAQRLALSPTPSGSAVLIPDEMLVKEYKQVPRAQFWKPEPTAGRTRGGTLEVRVTPPTSVGTLEAMTATLDINIRAPGWKMIVRGVVPDGRTETLADVDSPAGPRTLEVPQAGRFVADGVLRLRVEVSGADNTPWTCEDINVTLQGTAP